MNRAVMPTTIAPPVARYAHAVVSEGAGGCCTRPASCRSRPTARCPTDLGEQAAVVWANLAAILAAAEMAVTDIVAVTTYVVVGNELGPGDGRPGRGVRRTTSRRRRSSRSRRSPAPSGRSRSPSSPRPP